MTENVPSGQTLDPHQPIAEAPFAPVDASPEAEDGVIAILTPDLRVIRGERYWIMQQRMGKTWHQRQSFCATKEGLILAIKDWLLKEHLSKLGYYNIRQVQATNAKGKLVYKNIVSREALAATDTARAALKRNDMAGFGVSLEAWAVIQALPDFYPK